MKIQNEKAATKHALLLRRIALASQDQKSRRDQLKELGKSIGKVIRLNAASHLGVSVSIRQVAQSEGDFASLAKVMEGYCSGYALKFGAIDKFFAFLDCDLQSVAVDAALTGVASTADSGSVNGIIERTLASRFLLATLTSIPSVLAARSGNTANAAPELIRADSKIEAMGSDCEELTFMKLEFAIHAEELGALGKICLFASVELLPTIDGVGDEKALETESWRCSIEAAALTCPIETEAIIATHHVDLSALFTMAEGNVIPLYGAEIGSVYLRAKHDPLHREIARGRLGNSDGQRGFDVEEVFIR